MRVHLPSRLDVQQCCKRLLIAQDGYGLQFMPERDELGRESETLWPVHYVTITERYISAELNRHDPDKVKMTIPALDDTSSSDLHTVALPPQNAAAVRADYPIPPQAGVYYYEVEVVSRGQMGYIGIGFSTRNVNVERLPGEDSQLCATCQSALRHLPGYSTEDCAQAGNLNTRTAIMATTARPSLAAAKGNRMVQSLALVISSAAVSTLFLGKPSSSRMATGWDTSLICLLYLHIRMPVGMVKRGDLKVKEGETGQQSSTVQSSFTPPLAYRLSAREYASTLVKILSSLIY